jgi:hypothetical protein
MRIDEIAKKKYDYDLELLAIEASEGKTLEQLSQKYGIPLPYLKVIISNARKKFPELNIPKFYRRGHRKPYKYNYDIELFAIDASEGKSVEYLSKKYDLPHKVTSDLIRRSRKEFPELNIPAFTKGPKPGKAAKRSRNYNTSTPVFALAQEYIKGTPYTEIAKKYKYKNVKTAQKMAINAVHKTGNQKIGSVLRKISIFCNKNNYSFDKLIPELQAEYKKYNIRLNDKEPNS